MTKYIKIFKIPMSFVFIIFLSCSKPQEIKIISKSEHNIRYFYLDDKVIAKWTYDKNFNSSKEGQIINGYVKMFWKDGAGEDYYEIIKYENNKVIDEKYNSYYLTGQKKSVFEIKNGMINGKIKEFYKDGKIKTEYFMTNNLKNGSYIEYFENGVTHRKENYKNGLLDGVLRSEER